MEKKRKNTQLVITIDFGGSMTKAIAVNAEGKQQLICLDPQVQRVSWESLLHYQKNIFAEQAAEDRAWVKLGNNFYAVGYLAKEQFRGTTKLSIPKYYEAVQKTLAVIWVLRTKLKLNRKLRVSLGCLLPPGEYQDREIFKEELIAALAKFVTPDGTIMVELTYLCDLTEGFSEFARSLSKGKEIESDRSLTTTTTEEIAA